MIETWPTCPHCGFEVFKWSNGRCPLCSETLPDSVIARSRALGGEPDPPDYAPALSLQAVGVPNGAGTALGLDRVAVARLFGAALGLLLVAIVLVGIVGGLGGTDIHPIGPTTQSSCASSYPDDCLSTNTYDYDCANAKGNSPVSQRDGPRYVRGPMTVDWNATHPDPFDLDPDQDGIACN